VIQRVPFTGGEKKGLVKHLASVEYGWFCRTNSADIVANYGRSRAAADVVIDEVGLEDVGTAWSGQTVSMRWVLIHMIEDTARHAGHMDILRELIDGQTGDHRPD
jgi:hypothetical protein